MRRSRHWIIRALGGWALCSSVLAAGAAAAYPFYGTYVDTTCTANGWVPPKPFNPNGGDPNNPSQVNCGLCHTNASSPNANLTAGGDQFRRSGHTDVSPFCSPPAANQPPVFTALAAQSAVVGSPFDLTVTARDPEGGPILLSLANAPAGSLFADAGNGSGSFLWTPTAADLGAHTLTFHAADTGTPMAVSNMDVVVAVGQAANLPPVLSPIGNQQLDAGATLAFTLSAQDPEGQPLVYSATGLPTGASLVGADFSWTPDSTQTGQHDVTFTVTDSGTPAASDSEAIVITVGRINRPPVLAPIGNRQVQVGTELRFVLTATDPDSDPIAIACTGLPSDASLDDRGDGTAEFVWSPLSAVRFDVTCTATDAGTPPESDSERFSLTAVDPASASAPRLEDAVWTPGDSGGTLRVRGALAPTTAGGTARRSSLDVFAVLSDGSAVLLGSRPGPRTGNFGLSLDPFIAPCSVAVGSAGAMSTALTVRNAPASCDTALLTRARASLSCDGATLLVSGSRGPIGGQVVASDANGGAPLGTFPVAERSGRFGGSASVAVAPTAIDLRAEVGGMSWSLETPVPVMQSNDCDESDEEHATSELEHTTSSEPLRGRRTSH